MQHIDANPCYRESFADLWLRMNKLGWSNVPVKLRNHAGKMVTVNSFQFSHTSKVLSGIENNLISEVKELTIQLEDVNAKSSSSSSSASAAAAMVTNTCQGLVPGIHVFTTEENLTQYISK